MGSKTYKTRAIVLKKTKLGDKDLIVTTLDETGALFQCVAKGARKPGGSFAARLELFSCSDLLLAKGRSLDVVCEARLAAPAAPRCATLEQSACASPVAELLAIVAQPGLEHPRLFSMAASAFDHIAALADEPTRALAITAASLWKVMGQEGFRPAIARCASCAEEIAYPNTAPTMPFSLGDGGVMCASCSRFCDAMQVDVKTLAWCETLINARYDDVARLDLDVSATFDILHLAQLWVSTHTARRLKSLDFLFTSGLF